MIHDMVPKHYPFKFLPYEVQLRHSRIFGKKEFIEKCAHQVIGIEHVLSAMSYQAKPKHLEKDFFNFVKKQEQLCEALGVAKDQVPRTIYLSYQVSQDVVREGHSLNTMDFTVQ